MKRIASNQQCLKDLVALVSVIGPMFLEFTSGDVYKIGMPVRKGCCGWDGMHIIGGAVNLAMDQLRSDQVMDDVEFR